MSASALLVDLVREVPNVCIVLHMLSRHSIIKALDEGLVGIEPFNKQNLREVSYILTLGHTIRVPQIEGPIDSANVTRSQKEVDISDGYTLEPGAFVLGLTAETLTLSPGIAVTLSTRGDFAQIGLDVLQSSALAEPGTNQQIILEIKNESLSSVILRPGIALVKAIFHRVE